MQTDGEREPGRIATIGFWGSVGSLPVFWLGLAIEAGALLAAGGIMWALGLGLSIAALNKRNRPGPGHRRLAIAGIAVAIVAIIALPVWFLIALISVLSNP